MSIDVSRFIQRKKAEYSVEVLTPMFLGGADGNGELRSPPFKNALRAWWRLARGNLSAQALLMAEQELFGGVTDIVPGKGINGDGKVIAGRSRVDVVVAGSVDTYSPRSKINIGYKKNPEAKGNNVSLGAYLGMGPIHFSGNLEKMPVLPGQKFKLSVSFSGEHEEEILDALSLFAHLGSLGSRSRNGWGGVYLHPENGTRPLVSLTDLYRKYGAELRSIFNGPGQGKTYPFRLGYQDSGNNEGTPLMWKIKDAPDWKKAMQAAAETYMDLRQVFKFPKEKPRGAENRHIMGYPVTGHPVQEWGGFNGRMPSQMRIVVRRTGNGFRSCFLHLPHRLPKRWDEKKLGSELSNWQELHSWLNRNCVPISL